MLTSWEHVSAARRRINEEYKKNKHVTDSEVVSQVIPVCKSVLSVMTCSILYDMICVFLHLQMIKLSKSVEEELRTTVVQAYESEPGKYGTYHFNYYVCI